MDIETLKTLPKNTILKRKGDTMNVIIFKYFDEQYNIPYCTIIFVRDSVSSLVGYSHLTAIAAEDLELDTRTEKEAVKDAIEATRKIFQ